MRSRLALTLPIAALAVLLGTTPGGAVDEITPYDVTDDLEFVQAVAVAPDGSVWGRGDHAIGRLNQATGAVDPVCELLEADYPEIDDQYLFEIAPDGQIWMGWTPDVADLRILRVDPVTCDIDDFELTDAEYAAADIDAQSDGTVWVSTFNKLLLIDGDDGTPIDAIDGVFPYFDSMVVRGGIAFGARRSDGTLHVIDPSGPSANELSPAGFTYINDVVPGPGGRIWFAGGNATNILVGSVAADGSDLQTHDIETTGITSGATFGPDGNLWVANNTPSELVVVSPAGPSVLRTVDLVEEGLLLTTLAADASAIWGAAVRDSTFVRIAAVDPVVPTPTAPPAQPAPAAPNFTG